MTPASGELHAAPAAQMPHDVSAARLWRVRIGGGVHWLVAGLLLHLLPISYILTLLTALVSLAAGQTAMSASPAASGPPAPVTGTLLALLPVGQGRDTRGDTRLRRLRGRRGPILLRWRRRCYWA